MSERVPCPVCRGEGQLDHQPPRGCLCCGGEGGITAEKDRTLAWARAELTRRMRERGISPPEGWPEERTPEE